MSARGEAPRRGRGVFAVATAGLGFAAAGCSLILDFSGSAEAEDAGAPDASPLEACDRYEPNDTLAEAASLDPGTYSLGLCDGDTADFWAFEIDEGSSLRVELQFEAEAGRRVLDLRLFNRTSEAELQEVSSASGEAILERSAALGNALPAGAYAVEVFLSETVTDPDPAILYDLELSY